jgi:hypothetical protein
VSGTDITLGELLESLGQYFMIVGGDVPVPLDRSKELLTLVAVTEQGLLNIHLKKYENG